MSRPPVAAGVPPALLLLAGCGGHPTFSRDVAPILEDSCVSCHSDGQIAPFALDTYANAAAMAPLMAEVTRSRRMPPWLVDASGECGTFSDAAWLSDDDIATIEAWAADPREGDAIAAIEPPDPGRLDRVDAVLDPGIDVVPDASSPDDYRCLVADPGLTEDAFLTAFEVVPGDPTVVHHVIAYTVDSDEAEALAERLDAEDDGPGYACFGSSLLPESRPIAAWAPGTPPTRLPDGSGLRLLGGRPVVLQVHYNTAGGSGPDRTVVNLQLEDAVQREALLYPLADMSMVVPAGRTDATATWELSLASMGLPLGVFVRGVFPHMHKRGTSMRLEAVHEGEATCMADVPRWDFDWQRLYLYDEPFYLYPQDSLRLTCVYDTSSDAEDVTWGEGTDDEMCLFGLLVTLG